MKRRRALLVLGLLALAGCTDGDPVWYPDPENEEDPDDSEPDQEPGVKAGSRDGRSPPIAGASG